LGSREDCPEDPEGLRFDPSVASALHTEGLAIAFEGCGCRAAFHAGAVEWLVAHGVRFTAVAGASSGALIAGAVALGRTSDLHAAWLELVGTRVCDPRRLLRGRWPFRMSEIVGRAARDYFGDTCLADTPIPVAVVVTQLGARGFARRTLTARDNVLLSAAVRASCFIPGPYSQMVPIDRRLTFDGAWLQRVPVGEAAELGASRVIACVSDDAGRLLRGAWRAVEVEAPHGVDYRVLSPVVPLPVGTFDFDRGATLESVEIGARSAELFAARHREWIGEATISRRSPWPDAAAVR
jgi:predicted acylesterase/phospholipase RssA